MTPTAATATVSAYYLPGTSYHYTADRVLLAAWFVPVCLVRAAQ